MAISNYAYHAQDPTPEAWVRHVHPCRIDRDLLRRAIGDGRGEALLSSDQVDQLRGLCGNLTFDVDTQQSHPNLYEALRALPFYDGLRVATIFSLVGKSRRHASGDLLRMPNNVLRLNEWQQLHRAGGGSEKTVLSLKLDEDWSEARYGDTADRVTGFILDDLRFQEDAGGAAGGATAAAELGRAKADFAAAVRQEVLSKRKSKRDNGSRHFTKGRVHDRAEVRAKLRADELFGPILSRIQTIVDSAYGLEKGLASGAADEVKE